MSLAISSIEPGSSGARVIIRTVPAPEPSSRSTTGGSGSEKLAGSIAPALPRLRNGPSRWAPRTSAPSRRGAGAVSPAGRAGRVRPAIVSSAVQSSSGAAATVVASMAVVPWVA